MTKVTIDPGPCGFTTIVTAQKNDDGNWSYTVGQEAIA